MFADGYKIVKQIKCSHDLDSQIYFQKLSHLTISVVIRIKKYIIRWKKPKSEDVLYLNMCLNYSRYPEYSIALNYINDNNYFSHELRLKLRLREKQRK